MRVMNFFFQRIREIVCWETVKKAEENKKNKRSEEKHKSASFKDEGK